MYKPRASYIPYLLNPVDIEVECPDDLSELFEKTKTIKRYQFRGENFDHIFNDPLDAHIIRSVKIASQLDLP